MHMAVRAVVTAVRRAVQMWKSSTHLPERQGIAYTGGSFYTHPAVHEDEVKNFIASEFSQWLGEKYGGVEEDSVVYTAGFIDGMKNKAKKTFNVGRFVFNGVKDAEEKLKTWEVELEAKNKQISGAKTGGEKRMYNDRAQVLIADIAMAKTYIATHNANQEKKRINEQLAKDKASNRDARKQQQHVVRETWKEHGEHKKGVVGRLHERIVHKNESTGQTSSPEQRLHSVGNNPVTADNNHYTHHFMHSMTDDESDDHETPEADPYGYTSIPPNSRKNSSVHSNVSQGPASLRRQNHTANYNTI
jgi:hypothetical protein